MSRRLRGGLGGSVAVVALAAVVFLRAGGGAPLPAGFASIREAAVFQQPALLERAWALPVAKTFPRPLLSQGNPSSCGPTSVANVLRSSGGATTPDEVAAHGAGCLGGFCFGGLTLAQLAEATRAISAEWKVTELRPATLDAFREELRLANDPSRRLIINFTRRSLFGEGGCHHSPIGGYLEPEDLVFVLDVNERFGPWLVSSERLYEAMDTIDPSTGQKRGLLRLTK